MLYRESEFERYWNANLLFRLRGVMGLSEDRIAAIKILLQDTWNEAITVERIEVYR